MTNQQGAPEALRHADGLESFAQMLPAYGFNPQPLKDAASELRRLAALVEAQQPATHVQNPAEIAHVAGDVSKNGPESNMAQQPAPSAAAETAQQDAACVGPCDRAPSGWLCTRQHGHDGPCAAEPTLSTRSDEWVEGYAAGVRDGRADALRAPQPSPTPQADSQPALVLEGERDLDAWKCERCHGKGWHWQSESVNHGKEIGVENVDLKTHCDACEGTGWCGPGADRAARAPADSVTAPAATPAAASIAWNALRDATDPLGETGTRIMGLVRVFAQRQYEAGLADGRTTPPAQAADSVLEDAAFEAVRKKLCALPRYSFVLDDDGLVRRVLDRSGNWIEFDAAHALFDPVAVDAARKQGANHD